MKTLKEAQVIHFIGIGGIGISAVARMMLLEGKKVSGSDRDASKVTEELGKVGATISIGHSVENIPMDTDLVVYTVAIPTDNPELLEAEKRGIAMLTYPQTLDEISKEKYTIAVSGTHGKTTTTAMIAKVMIDAGLDPTVIVGSLMKNPDGTESNFIAGKSEYLLVEADEYKKSFHNLHPTMLVVNNLDEDHLDFYRDLADIQDSFRHVALQVPAGGYVVTDLENGNVKPVIADLSCAVVNYQDFYNDSLKLKIPGRHNRHNAAVAAAVGQILGIAPDQVLKSLMDFAGTWRRFEYKGETKAGALVYDDYAHNPQKVAAAIEGAREYFPGKKVVVVYQPHLYSRTKTLFKSFVTAFDEADHVILTPIYPAREPFDPTISSEMLAEALKGRKGDSFAEAVADFSIIEERLKRDFDKPNAVIITMGAGDGHKIGEALL